MTASYFEISGERIIEALDRMNELVSDEVRLRHLAEAAVLEALNARDEVAVERVTAALRERLGSVVSRASRGPESVQPDELFWLDRIGIDVLAETAPHGQDLAHHVRDDAVERWELALAERDPDVALALWVAAPEREWQGEPFFVLYAAAAAWHDVVEPRLRSQLTDVPALSAAVLLGAGAALWRRVLDDNYTSPPATTALPHL